MTRTPHISRYASMIYRLGNRYYDRALVGDGIGCGQQFFLLRLSEKQGQGVKELARLGIYDKGTAARAVQKLEELGYLRREEDARDKRAQRLYTTPKAEPVIASTRATAEHWNRVLTQGLTPAEVAEAERLMTHMAKNAFAFIEREEQAYETNEHP